MNNNEINIKELERVNGGALLRSKYEQLMENIKRKNSNRTSMPLPVSRDSNPGDTSGYGSQNREHIIFVKATKAN